MWQNIRGHDAVADRFRRALDAGRMASTFLFVGPAGIGKHTFAVALARALLCQRSSETQLEACGECESCRLAAAGSHPDILLVKKPEEKSYIPVAHFIGDKDHRGREGMCHDIALKPFLGGRRVAIVDDADHLNQEGANCLLKTLEEPPPRSVLILISTSVAQQLPTIRSRCQIVRFDPLPVHELTELILAQRLADDRQAAAELAEISDGSLERAADLADPDLRAFRTHLFEQLAVPDVDSVRLAPEVSKFVDEAGREAPKRRARLRQVIGFAIEFYRRRLHEQTTGLDTANLDRGGPSTLPAGRAIYPETTVAQLDRCFDALYHVERNANQSTLIEAWVDDLAQLELVA